MEMLLRNFKWYRKMKGGKWWWVKHDFRKTTPEYYWMWSGDTISFPEWDGLYSDDTGSFSTKSGFYCPYYGWEDMQNTPTESYGEN